MSLATSLAGLVLVSLLGLLSLTGGETPLVRLSHYTASSDLMVNASNPAKIMLAPAPRTPALSAKGDTLSVLRQPSVDVAAIRRVLQQFNSPAVGEAQAIYDLGRQYGIDPAVCLAFFVMESSAGTRGMATETRSVGNIRATPGYVNHKGYRKYATWREGIDDWYLLISRLYVGEWGLTTVEAIVPVYAPAADSNDPSNYINTVRRLVREWSDRQV